MVSNCSNESNFYPPQGGSIRGFYLSITSSNKVNTVQLRSITVNCVQLKSIEICQSVGPSIGWLVGLVHRSVGPYVIRRSLTLLR